MRVFWIVLVFTIFFSGCEKKIYTKIYDEKLAKEPISCLNLKYDNEIVGYIIKNRPPIKKLLKNECPFTLSIVSHYVTSCSSARAKALGSDFDGFVRFEILKNGRLIYRNQRDFKGYFDESVSDSLINKMLKDLNFNFSKK